MALLVHALRYASCAGKFQHFLGAKVDQIKQNLKRAGLGRFLSAQVVPFHIVHYMREINLGVQVAVVGIVDELGQPSP